MIIGGCVGIVGGGAGLRGGGLGKSLGPGVGIGLGVVVLYLPPPPGPDSYCFLRTGLLAYGLTLPSMYCVGRS